MGQKLCKLQMSLFLLRDQLDVELSLCSTIDGAFRTDVVFQAAPAYH